MLMRGTSSDQTPVGETQQGVDDKASWTDWLNRNQRESWQMELLVTGFAIVLIAGAKEPLEQYLDVIAANTSGTPTGTILSTAFAMFIRLAWVLTMTSLVFGALLRSLWGSSIGVRSFSGDIDWSSFDLAPEFSRFLHRRVPSFDDYILRLEQVCSSIFALTFLLVFAVVGVSILFTVVSVILMGVSFVLVKADLSIPTLGLVIVLLSLVLGLFPLLYAIDFFSGGALKRRGGIAKVYYPVYRLLSWMVFARIYRPLYYNLVDNSFGRKLLLFTIPYSIIILSALVYRGEFFTPLLMRSENFGVGAYEEYGDNDARAPGFPYLNTMITDGDYVVLHIPMTGYVYRSLERCDSIGKQLSMRSELAADRAKSRRIFSDYLSCATERIYVGLDGNPIEVNSFILTTPGPELPAELVATVKIDTLGPGAHSLEFARRRGENRLDDWSSIPFIIP